MKTITKIAEYLLYFLVIPIIYLLTSLALTKVTIEKKDNTSVCNKTLYLSTNGVHLDIILPKKDIDYSLLKGLNHEETDKYLSFGWGDENFYINTPTWNDLTFKNAFSALFLKSASLMHVTRYQDKKDDWIEIKVTNTEFQKLNNYINTSFIKDENENIIILKNKEYSSNDNFYKANGSYSCLNTCNTWVNSGFKKSDLKSCYWTPFDFGLLKKYQ